MISFKSPLFLNRAGFTSLAAAVMCVGFVGCDSSDSGNPAPLNPGTQAGYAQAGSNACSQELTDGYDQIGQAIKNMKDQDEALDPKAADARDQLHGLQGWAEQARKDAVEDQQRFPGVSCVATINEKTVYINPAKVEEHIAELDTLYEKFKKEEADLSDTHANTPDHRGDSKR